MLALLVAFAILPLTAAAPAPAATPLLPRVAPVAPAAHAAVAMPRAATSTVPVVPFYSQFADIASPRWQKVGCGITDLTMLIHYYRPDATTTVDRMLAKGIAAGAYDYGAGWTYQGLIDLGVPYGLTGRWVDLSGLGTSAAFARFTALLASGPVILSVHYKFDPASTIPHLVVINGIAGDTVYYNDPATTGGTRQISVAQFLRGWKRKVIIIRPVTAATTTIAVR